LYESHHDGLIISVMKKITHSWETLPSGLAVPIGTTTDISNHVKTPYLAIKTKAEEIEALYANSRVELPRSCELSNLIENAKLYWENWFTVQTDNLDMAMLFRMLHLDRIATDILLLKDVEGREKYLRTFASGSLDFFKREKSSAKDLLWEIEVWAQLRRKFSSVSLEEPPDIVMHVDDAKIGIACKKLYSEKHVQNVLSQAVAQIEDSFWHRRYQHRRPSSDRQAGEGVRCHGDERLRSASERAVYPNTREAPQKVSIQWPSNLCNRIYECSRGYRKCNAQVQQRIGAGSY
jgi:hypothetical protein